MAGCKNDSEQLHIFGPQAICDEIKVNDRIEKIRFPLPLKYIEFLLLKNFPPASQENGISSQPFTNWQLLYRMAQYGVNIGIHLVCKVW